MFFQSSDTPKRKEAPADATLIARGAIIRGEIHLGESALRIEGQFEGTIHGRGEITVETSGQMAGTISARNLIVAGRAEGVFRVEGRMEIRSTGFVEGEMEAGSIVVDEGGILEGSCSRPGAKARVEPPAAKMADLPDYSGSRSFGAKPN